MLLYIAVTISVLISNVHGSDFADDLASCAAENVLNICLRQTLEDLRPLMRTGIPQLNLPVTEPMNVEEIEFEQGQPPVIVKAAFSNVVVKGLSNFVTDYIDADPNTQTLRIGLTVPEMDISGLYRINGEVFILPLEGSGSFTTKMTGVTAVGQSNILPIQNAAGKQVLQVDNSNIDFNIGRVFIHMNNLFNGENKLLADTVNKFLNDHGQEVLKEVKPEISRQLTQLVTRVMNDAFSELPADKLLNNLNRSARSGHSLISSNAPVITFPLHHNVERRGHAHRGGLFRFLHGKK